MGGIAWNSEWEPRECYRNLYNFMQYFPYSWNEQPISFIKQTLIIHPLKLHPSKFVHIAQVILCTRGWNYVNIWLECALPRPHRRCFTTPQWLGLHDVYLRFHVDIGYAYLIGNWFMMSSPPYPLPIEWIYLTTWSSGRRIIVNLSSCFECGPHERLYPQLYSLFRASTCEAQTLLRYTTQSKCIAWLAVKSWRSKQGGPWVLLNWPNLGDSH